MINMNSIIKIFKNCLKYLIFFFNILSKIINLKNCILIHKKNTDFIF